MCFNGLGAIFRFNPRPYPRHGQLFPRTEDGPLRTKAPRKDPSDLPDEEIASLRKTVVMVDMPAPALERRIEAQGKTIVRIDRHLYARAGEDEVDRRHGLSAWEQLVQLFGVPLPDETTVRRAALIAANDRGFIPGIGKALLRLDPGKEDWADERWKAAHAIRMQELEMVVGRGKNKADAPAGTA